MRIIAKSPLGYDADAKLGPGSSFKVLGALLLMGADELQVAHWSDHQWVIGSKRYTTLDLDEPTLVQFLGASPEIPAIGPFRQVRMADGSVIGDGVILARFRAERDAWTTATRIDCAGFRLEPYAAN